MYLLTKDRYVNEEYEGQGTETTSHAHGSNSAVPLALKIIIIMDIFCIALFSPVYTNSLRVITFPPIFLTLSEKNIKGNMFKKVIHVYQLTTHTHTHTHTRTHARTHARTHTHIHAH